VRIVVCEHSFFARLICGKLLIPRCVISAPKLWIKAVDFWLRIFQVMRLPP